jgi:hypothetical protein
MQNNEKEDFIDAVKKIDETDIVLIYKLDKDY